MRRWSRRSASMQQEARRFLQDDAKPPVETGNDERVKIYFLPNLMTAGNLMCGFMALKEIFKYEQGEDFEPIKMAIRFILAAFLFDFLDGRLARLTKKLSQFGRE